MEENRPEQVSFKEAKNALMTYFAEEQIEEFGHTEEEFQQAIDNVESFLYEESFIQSTALCFDFVKKTKTGYDVSS